MKYFGKKKNIVEENQDTNDILKDSFATQDSEMVQDDQDDFILSKFADSIARGIKGSFLGYIFADLYAQLNRKWKAGAIYQLFHKKKNLFRARSKVANLHESSFINAILSWFGKKIIQTYARILGTGLFVFGIMVILMGILQYSINPGFATLFNESGKLAYLDKMFWADGYYLIVGFAFVFVSLPLTTSKKRVGEMLLTGRVSKYIIHQLLTVEESKFESDSNAAGGSYVFALELGVLFGCLSFLARPLTMLGIVLFFIAFAMILCYPEIGIMGIMFMIPFANIFDNPSLILMFFIMLTALSFLFKFIKGKRIMRFELVDLGVLVWGVMIALSAIFTEGGKASVLSSFMYCGFLCIYFLIVNSYIRKTWIYRGIKMMVIGTVIISIIAIIEGGVADPTQTDMSMFFNMGARINAFFGNPNMLGFYLVIVFPFMLAQTSARNKTSIKLFYALCFLVVIVAIVLTYSRGAWLGLITATAVFFIVVDFRNIWVVLLGGAALVPAIMYLAPESVSQRFFSIITMSDSSSMYRQNLWNGVRRMISANFWTGIGVGESAFTSVFPQFATKGTETVVHSHSMIYQILIELGIFGLIVFLITMFMFTQKCFLGIKTKRRGSKSRAMIAAGYASVCATFVMGIADHVFYNYRLFLIFWMFVGLTVSLTKINEKEVSKLNEATKVNSSSRSADLDILIEE